MVTGTPKLPARWQAKAYQVDPMIADGGLSSSDPFIGQFFRAIDQGLSVVLHPIRSEFDPGRWDIGVFVSGDFVRRLSNPSGVLVDAVILAERLSASIPGAKVVGELVRAPQVSLAPMKASDLAGKEIEPRKWHVRNMIPAGDVTSLYGDGGTGKSLVALQLAVSTVTGRHWLGSPVTEGGCLFFTAEDDLNELHRRLATIAAAEGLKLSELASLEMVSLAGEDAMLAYVEDDGRTLTRTPLLSMLEKRVGQQQPALIVLDTLADIFPGDENSKLHTRQFVTLLRHLALGSEAAVVVLAHPSVAGMASGFGTSGNTAWNNSVRARLYLERVYQPHSKIRDRLVEPDPDVRTLTNKKLNYGPAGKSLTVRWADGVFAVLAAPLATALASPPAADAAQVVDDRFLELLALFTVQGANVSPKPTARNYAPTLFARHADGVGIRRSGYEAAMHRLLADGRVKVEKSAGAQSRQSDVLATAG